MSCCAQLDACAWLLTLVGNVSSEGQGAHARTQFCLQKAVERFRLLDGRGNLRRRTDITTMSVRGFVRGNLEKKRKRGRWIMLARSFVHGLHQKECTWYGVACTRSFVGYDCMHVLPWVVMHASLGTRSYLVQVIRIHIYIILCWLWLILSQPVKPVANRLIRRPCMHQACWPRRGAEMYPSTRLCTVRWVHVQVVSGSAQVSSFEFLRYTSRNGYSVTILAQALCCG